MWGKTSNPHLSQHSRTGPKIILQHLNFKSDINSSRTFFLFNCLSHSVRACSYNTHLSVWWKASSVWVNFLFSGFRLWPGINNTWSTVHKAEKFSFVWFPLLVHKRNPELWAISLLLATASQTILPEGIRTVTPDFSSLFGGRGTTPFFVTGISKSRRCSCSWSMCGRCFLHRRKCLILWIRRSILSSAKLTFPSVQTSPASWH